MESKPSPLNEKDKKELEDDLKKQVADSVRKQERLNALKKRTGAFQADVVELEKKHGLRLVAVLNQSHNGIFPGMIVVDPEEHPEYAAPHVGPTPPSEKKILKKKKD